MLTRMVLLCTRFPRECVVDAFLVLDTVRSTLVCREVAGVAARALLEEVRVVSVVAALAIRIVVAAAAVIGRTVEGGCRRC
jgi:hypothetical protein